MLWPADDAERPRLLFSYGRALNWAEEMGYGHCDIASLFQVLAAAAASPVAATGPGTPSANAAAPGPKAA